MQECNHCETPVNFSKLTDFQRMCFRGMCHECESLTLAERIEKFPKVRALADRIGSLGLGVNGPFEPGFMKGAR